MRWQPISEAPKDGTVLLLWEDSQPDIGYWSSDTWRQADEFSELRPTHFMLITPPGEQQPESVIRRGWREFECYHGDDNHATYRWAEPTRDRFSPSQGDCPRCDECVRPIRNWPDAELPVDSFGNLTAEKTQPTESVNQRLLDAAEAALRYVESDETAHGRRFGTGNALRAAIEAAKQATNV